MRGLKKLASSPNKISKSESPLLQTPTFELSILYSVAFHLILVAAFFIFTKFSPSVWKKPIPAASVVWTQTVKRPAPTIPDKLPPPLVPLKKVEETKAEEINVHKKPEPIVKKTEESRSEKMKKALEKLKQNVTEDDRPAPKEDNFATTEPDKPNGSLNQTEMLALQSSSIYSAYEQQIKEAIQSNFIWYKPGVQFVTHVSMKIDPQGNVSNIKIEKSSGDFSYDQATLRAVQKANPLPAPPSELVPLFMQEDVVINFQRQTS